MSGKSELILLNDPIQPQIVIDHGIFCDINPVSGVDGPTIEFVINGSHNEYLDMNDTILYLKLKVVKPDDTKFGDDTKAYTSNYLMNALFADVSLSLNNKVIEGGSLLEYPYKSTIESIFNFNEDARRLQLLPAGFSDEIDERVKWISKSQTFELCGALRLNFLNQPKYLLPNVDVKILLNKSKNEFSLMVPAADKAGAAKIVIERAVLYVRKVKVSPAVQL